MNDYKAFTDNILPGLKIECERSPLEEAVGKARHDAHVHIGKARIDIQELPNRKIARIVTEHERVIFVTADARYVVVEAKAYYDSGPFIETEDQLDINEAYEVELLPQALYEAVRDAERARDEYDKEQHKVRRLREVISENGGLANVRGMLDDIEDE
jgi:hypothetical protein